MMSKENKTQSDLIETSTALSAISYAVIPDSARLDLGPNKIIAIFKHKHQAEFFAKSLWEMFYIIKEVQCEHLA